MAPSPGDLLGDRDDPYGRKPVEGIVAVAPASSTDLLKVNLPSFDDDGDTQDWSLRWMPRGADLPTPGDRCLIVFPQDAPAWVVAWWPST